MTVPPSVHPLLPRDISPEDLARAMALAATETDDEREARIAAEERADRDMHAAVMAVLNARQLPADLRVPLTHVVHHLGWGSTRQGVAHSVPVSTDPDALAHEKGVPPEAYHGALGFLASALLTVPGDGGPMLLRSAEETLRALATMPASEVERVLVNSVNNSLGVQNEEWEEPTPLAGGSVRPPWPDDVFAPGVEAFVVAAAEALQVPRAMVGQAVLGALATAMQRRAVVEVRRGWTEPLSLFVATVLPSGERKTAALAAVFAPVREAESRVRIEAEPRIAEARARRDLVEAKVKRAQSEAVKGKGDAALQAEAEYIELSKALAGPEFRVPEPPRLTADDCTPEQLVELLHNGGGRMAVVSAEGTTLSHARGMYRDDGMANLGVWLHGHAGEDIRVDRMGRSTEVPRAAVSMCVSLQPGDAAKAISDGTLRDRGLFARIAWAWPEPMVGRRAIEADPVPEETEREYRVVMDALLRLESDEDAGGYIVPTAVSLSPGAYHGLMAFAADHEPRLAPGGDLGALADWGGKAVGLTARVAGLLHAADCADLGTDPRTAPVTAGAMDRAIRLVRDFYIPHALLGVGISGADPKVALAQRILDWIKDKGVAEFSIRDCHRDRLINHVQEVRDLDAPLALLADHGFIRPLKIERGGRGRPPSPRFAVNPVWLGALRAPAR